jgi:hypothetical protein
MSIESLLSILRTALNAILVTVCLAVLPQTFGHVGYAKAASDSAPAPRFKDGKPVDWWFAFKFNAKSFAGCGAENEKRQCSFGGEVQSYAFSQQFVYASSESQILAKGGDA